MLAGFFDLVGHVPCFLKLGKEIMKVIPVVHSRTFVLGRLFGLAGTFETGERKAVLSECFVLPKKHILVKRGTKNDPPRNDRA